MNRHHLELTPESYNLIQKRFLYLPLTQSTSQHLLKLQKTVLQYTSTNLNQIYSYPIETKLKSIIETLAKLKAKTIADSYDSMDYIDRTLKLILNDCLTSKFSLSTPRVEQNNVKNRTVKHQIDTGKQTTIGTITQSKQYRHSYCSNTLVNSCYLLFCFRLIVYPWRKERQLRGLWNSNQK